MPVFFTRLSFGYPDDYKPPVDKPNSWKIYVPCEPENPGDNSAKRDVWGLEEADKLDARHSFVNFTNRAYLGFPLEALYDEKQLHAAHSFKLNEHDTNSVKIFRIWGSGKIRIYFIYLPNKRIVILKTAPKRTDKLSAGEKGELTTLALSVLRSVETFGFEEV